MIDLAKCMQGTVIKNGNSSSRENNGIQCDTGGNSKIKQNIKI